MCEYFAFKLNIITNKMLELIGLVIPKQLQSYDIYKRYTVGIN